jgi:hypothetical protein
MGPMMVIDLCKFMCRNRRTGRPLRVLLLVATLCAEWVPVKAGGEASAASPRGAKPIPPVGVADARQAGTAAQLYFSRGVPGPRLSYFRLSDPSATTAQCCLSTQGRPVPDLDVPNLTAAEQQETMRIAAVLDHDAAASFIGVAFDGTGATAQRLSPHQVRIKWAGQKLALDVFHCVSSEGMHVRVAEIGAGGELAHYYVPLGLDVEADCTPDLMPGL